MSVPQSDLNDPALATEVDLARTAAQEEAGDEQVGAYVEFHVEDDAAVTYLFEADKAGYGGWRWAVTVTSGGPDTDVTVSEVVLLPGPTALVAPEWVPWQDRVQAGDLGVGDLLPTSPDDPRLVPAYLESDDPAVEDAALEVGLGRMRVMARPARLDAATRWQDSEFGPQSDMARSAPGHCGTCGFYLPLAGSLRAAFGTCGNEISPADGHVVHIEYGCGAHSEAEVEQISPVLVADLIYDDALLDVEPLTVADEIPTDSPADSAAIAAEQPAESVATDTAVVESPAEPAPVESATVDTASVEPVASEPVAADSISIEPAADAAAIDSVSTDSTTTDSVVIDSAPVELVAESAPAESATADSDNVEPAVSEPVSTEPGADAAATDSLSVESGGAASEPVATDSAVVESAAEPAPVESATADAASAEPDAEASATSPEQAPDIDAPSDPATLGAIGSGWVTAAAPTAIEPAGTAETPSSDDDAPSGG